MFFGFITLILVLTQVFSHFSAVDKIYDLYGVSLGGRDFDLAGAIAVSAYCANLGRWTWGVRSGFLRRGLVLSALSLR